MMSPVTWSTTSLSFPVFSCASATKAGEDIIASNLTLCIITIIIRIRRRRRIILLILLVVVSLLIITIIIIIIMILITIITIYNML